VIAPFFYKNLRMGRLHDIRLKSNQFVANMDVHIAHSIESVETQLVNMNKGQMLASKDSKDKPLIHKSTGSEFLTNLYAVKTRKSKPNLFLSGEFQRFMFLSVNENNLTYFIDSEDGKSGILTDNYGLEIFGIPQKRNTDAKQLTSAAFKQKYESMVLR